MNLRFWLKFLIGAAGWTALGILVGLHFTPLIKLNNPLANSEARKSAAQTEMDLADLLSKPPQDLDQVSLATLYLTCMAGLPGMDGLSIPDANKRVDELANQARKSLPKMEESLLKQNKNLAITPLVHAQMLMYLLKNDELLPQRVRAQLAGYEHIEGPERFFPRNVIDPNFIGQILNNPYLFLAVGEKLQYPVHLVNSDGHLLVRWDDGVNHFDIDEISPDGPTVVLDQKLQVATLDPHCPSMTKRQILALAMRVRGSILDTQHRPFEAEVAYAKAHELDPGNKGHVNRLQNLIKLEMQGHGLTWKDLTENNLDYFNLMPPKTQGR